MATTKNTTKTTATIKVSVRKLPANVVQAFNDIEEFEASILGSWLIIGTAVMNGETTTKDILAVHPKRKSSLSKATTIALGVSLGFELSDEDGYIYHSLNTAYESAKAFINDEEITVEEAKAKSQRKVAGTVKQTGKDIIKSLGKAEAKALALDILANL
jgi:hypothetical protein